MLPSQYIQQITKFDRVLDNIYDEAVDEASKQSSIGKKESEEF